MRTVSFVSLALVVAGISTACAVDTGEVGPEQVATGEEALCANNSDHAINAMFATLSAAMALELGRVEFVQDFEVWVDRGPNGWTYQEKVRLKQNTVNQLCNPKPHRCQVLNSLLSFQDDARNQQYKFAYGSSQVTFQADVFRNRLVAGHRSQQVCEQRGANDPNGCKAEAHSFEVDSARSGPCNLDIIKYKVTKPGTQTPLAQPAQLARKFIWADTDGSLPLNNPYLQFAQVGPLHVEWDPSLGGVGLDGNGACGTSLLKLSTVNITGSCCTVNGVTKTYRPYTVTNYYICQ